jgi:hypothetical protein
VPSAALFEIVWWLQQPQGWLRMAANVCYMSSESGETRAGFSAVYRPLVVCCGATFRMTLCCCCCLCAWYLDFQPSVKLARVCECSALFSERQSR